MNACVGVGLEVAVFMACFAAGSLYCSGLEDSAAVEIVAIAIAAVAGAARL